MSGAGDGGSSGAAGGPDSDRARHRSTLGAREGAVHGPPALGPGVEFDRIRRYLAAGFEARPDVRVGPGDDCAVVVGDGIAISTDLAVEGVHFRREWLDAREIGYRAGAAALSDLAAIAARPIGVFVSLAVPADGEPDDAEIVAGVRAAAERVDAVLLGGDLTASPGPVAIDVVVVGEASSPALRSGARPGDELWVTGSLGGAAAAVAAWRAGERPTAAAREAFAAPRPRVAEARWLADRAAVHALIDISDGLAGDAAHLAAASGVAIVVEPARVPVHPAAREVLGSDHQVALRLALAGGEDYELLFAAPPGAVGTLVDEFEVRFGTGLRRVGAVREGSGLHAVADDGTLEPLRAHGYRHFEDDAS